MSSPVLTIASMEFRRLLLSPFSWITLATTQFLLAIFFYLLLSRYMQAAPARLGIGITSFVVVGLFQVCGLFMLIIVPLVSMRLFSDELRNGTIKLLLSSPISLTQIVLGKYFGHLFFLLLLITLTALMPLSLVFGTTLDMGVFLACFMAMFLLCAALTAIGVFASSLSKSPAVAAISSFILSFLLWIAHVANDGANEFLQELINYLSLQKHFNALLSGAFSSVDLIYYLLLSMLFLILTIWRLDSLRTHQ